MKQYAIRANKHAYLDIERRGWSDEPRWHTADVLLEELAKRPVVVEDLRGGYMHLIARVAPEPPPPAPPEPAIQVII